MNNSEVDVPIVEFDFSPTGARAGLWFTCWVTLRVLANLFEIVLLSTDGE